MEWHLESSCKSLGHLLGDILTLPQRLDSRHWCFVLENPVQNDMEDGRKDSRYTSAIPIDSSVPHCQDDILLNLSHARPCPPLFDLFPRPCFHRTAPIVLVGLTVLRATLRVAQQSPPVPQRISKVIF